MSYLTYLTGPTNSRTPKLVSINLVTLFQTNGFKPFRLQRAQTQTVHSERSYLPEAWL